MTTTDTNAEADTDLGVSGVGGGRKRDERGGKDCERFHVFFLADRPKHLVRSLRFLRFETLRFT